MLSPIPFVGGLDRDAGSMVARPGSMSDLRNVIVSEGRLIVRSGLSRVQTFVDDNGDPITHICAIHPLRTERVGLVVGYNSVTGKVHVYRTTEEGKSPVLLAKEGGERFWFQIPAGSPPPRIFAADTYAKVFFAHDESALAPPGVNTLGRAPTIFYDPLSPTLRFLNADLDGKGESAVRFRGVAKYLDYLWGWGFGTASDQDRPEILRVSLPGEPDRFDPEHYFIVGQRGDPILNCIPTAATLVVLKEADTYRTVGTSSADFGYLPLDPLHGVASSRLAVSVGGACFFWSSSGGPRVTDGNSPSQELAIQLDLPGPTPATLVEAGSIRNAFAAYEPESRTVLFVFGKRVYALNVRRAPEWAYWELSIEPFCAGTLYSLESGGAVLGPSTGYPVPHDPEDWPQINDFSAVFRWDNVSPIGGEILEVWIRPDGGEWTHWADNPIDQGSVFEDWFLGGGTPETGGALLAAGTQYDMALRYRRANQYSADYTGADPDEWQALIDNPDRIVTFTTLATRRVWDHLNTQWSRTSETTEQIHLQWSGGDEQVGTRIFKSDDPAGPWTHIHTADPGETQYDYEIQDDAEGEQNLYFYLEPGDSQDPAPNAPTSVVKKIWVGPRLVFGDSNGDGSFSSAEGPFVGWNGIATFDRFDNPIEDPHAATAVIRFVPVPNTDTELWHSEDGAAFQEVAGSPFAFEPGIITRFMIVKRPGNHAFSVRSKLVSQFNDKTDWGDFSPVVVIEIPPTHEAPT